MHRPCRTSQGIESHFSPGDSLGDGMSHTVHDPDTVQSACLLNPENHNYSGTFSAGHLYCVLHNHCVTSVFNNL